MNGKKRYLFLAITEGFAGAEHFLVDYFAFIDHNKYSVTLGVKRDVFTPYLQMKGLPVEVVSLPESHDGSKFFPKLLRYYRFFRSVNPECVVFNQYWLRSFMLPEILAGFTATWGNAYMIVHDCPPVHPSYPMRLRLGFIPDFGLPWRLRRLFQTLLGYFTKSTLTVSKAARDTLVNLHHFPSRKVKIAYHGIDVSKFRPSPGNREKLRRQLGIPLSDIVVVSTAMLWPVKCVERLVKAFAVIAGKQRNMHLLIAGTGSEHKRLNDLGESFDNAINERIRFLGFRDDIDHLLQASDIYVLPSDSEGLPLACLEAMASGVISIVTDSGGTSEIIQNGCNGFLVEKSDEGILDGLRAAISLNDEEKSEMACRARRFVEERFNLEKNIRSGLSVLQLPAC